MFNDSCIINIYRKKQLYGSGTKIEIQINSNPIIRLKSGQRVSVSTRLRDTLRIQSYNKLNGKFSENMVTILPKAGEVFYVETNFWGDVFTPDRFITHKPVKFGIDIFLMDRERGIKDFHNDDRFKDTEKTIQKVKFPNHKNLSEE
jgi:hypothetical protein